MRSERTERLKTPESYRDTAVPLARTQASIESILGQFGCEGTSIATIRRGEAAYLSVRFATGARLYRMEVDLGEDPRDHRQRARVLYWSLKAMLEAVAFGLMQAEEMLLPFAEVDDGQGGRTTVGRVMLPRLTQAALPEASEIWDALPLKALPAGKSGR